LEDGDMDAVDELAQSMIARCAVHGYSVAEVDDRHVQEALRSQLRRLARRWQLRIRTVARRDRVMVARVNHQPWDDDEREAVRKIDQALGVIYHDPQETGQPPNDTAADPD
jgi:hypothetical protein